MWWRWITSESNKTMERIGVRQATKEGVIPMQIPGVCDLSYPTSKLRRGRVQGGGTISPTITTSCGVVKIIKWKRKLGQ